MKDTLSIPGPCMMLLQFEVTKGRLVMISCYSWSDKELQSIPQQSICYTKLSSLHLQLPDIHQGPLLLPASPGERLKIAQWAEMEITSLACCWADRLAALTLWSWAAQLCTSSFHGDIIFDIQFETLNSFNAISQHNDSNKAVPLAFDLTTKRKVERGRKQPQLC